MFSYSSIDRRGRAWRAAGGIILVFAGIYLFTTNHIGLTFLTIAVGFLLILEAANSRCILKHSNKNKNDVNKKEIIKKP